MLITSTAEYATEFLRDQLKYLFWYEYPTEDLAMNTLHQGLL